ncbi:MAG: formylglycine-generating enzyme family protein [Novosphingobium sp.]|jgi:formylglycine-generating enzyme required for sulfatase activity|nr:formylglycine-generating enzyme family protein [Novosphingobium sp.]
MKVHGKVSTVLLTGALFLTGSHGVFAQPSAGLAPGTVFRDRPVAPEMVVIPAGTFMMGSPASERGRYGDEGPQHQVRVPAFAAGKYEVTFAEWDACVADGGCGEYKPDDAGWGRGRRPVINVSWDDAQSYVMWLSRTTGKRYRLLSEAEWEYAARAGTTTAYSTGVSIDASQANFEERGLARTEAVGNYRANGFGLHDVHGNVWEWVQDCWNESYQGAPADGRAQTTGDCSQRVLRGGSWGSNAANLRSALRGGLASGARSSFFGFRVARTLD